jgi:hypothetical protein
MVLAGRRFFAGVWVVAVAPAGIEAVLRADLGEARLEQLEVPLLPVATNLSRARADRSRDPVTIVTLAGSRRA